MAQIKKTLVQAYAKLIKARLPNPHLDAELLLSDCLKISREELLAHPGRKINFLQTLKYKLQIIRCLNNTPLAYLLGHKGFYGLDLKVNKQVLTPRPETETMVDEVLALLRNILRNKECVCIDVGTGSGCILLAVINELKKSQHPLDSIQFHATDISKGALKVAEENAKRHKLVRSITFHRGNLIQAILQNKKQQSSSTKYVITANLPYLKPGEMREPSIRQEPKLALLAGKDGLKYYKELFKQIKEYDLSSFYLICEINPDQRDGMKKLAKEILNLSAHTKKDLRGLDRFIFINKL